MTDTPVRIRLAVESDVNYMLKTWRETYRTSLWARRMDNQVYHSFHRKVCEDLLRTATTAIAANNDDPTHILGFMVGERMRGALVIHFAFVRFELRRWGVAKLMLHEVFERRENEPIVCSHWVRMLDDLPPAYRLVYNPYVLFQQFRERLNGRHDSSPAQSHPQAEGDAAEASDGQGRGALTVS